MEIKTEEYLRSTSALAQKIGQDLDAVREAYQDLWKTLSPHEQQQVLDEAIIDPAAVIKYAKCKRNDSEDSYGFHCDNQFSWFTKSQLDLFTEISFKAPKTPSKKSEVITNSNNNNLPQEPVIIGNKTKELNLLYKIKNKVTNLKIPSTFEEKQSLVEAKPQVTVMKSLAKPKTPPPPPPTKPVLTEKKALLAVDNESDPDDIPKTGFDFLDNW